MALNGSKSVTVTAYDTLKFTWTQVGQSVTGNTTTINWTLQLVAGSAGAIISSAAKAWSVTINGTTYSGTNSVAIGNNTSKTLASGQVTIAHNSDGTKSFNYSFSQAFGITFAGASVGTITGSGTGVLNTIPRATTPGLSTTSADMDTTIIIYTAGASDSFTHDLAYSFAGGAYQGIASGVKSMVYWKIPLDLANSIPNTTSGTVTIRCITKNGGTIVGTTTVLMTAKVPATVGPTVDAVTHTEASPGLAEVIGAYVQGKSKVTVNVAASGAHGSTITSYTSTLGGKSYAGEAWTSDILLQSGTLDIKTTVTDSRGRTATKTTSLTVLGYSSPQINTFSVARYNSSGEADPDGVYLRARLVYSVTPLNDRNTAAARVEYKRSIDSSWTALATYTSLSMDGTLMPQGVTFSTDYQWDVRVSLTDAFNSAAPATYNAVLPSGAVILDIRADGKGIAFFKTSTKDGVEIAGELPGSAVSLTTNQNLNNLTTPGFYVIPTTAISATITNKPYTDTATASIRVERTGDGSVKQTLQKSTKTDGVIYERGYDSSGWGAWGIVYSGAGKILWSGTSLLTGSQTVTFSEPISQQQSGIVVVFSRYASSTAQDYYYNCHFVPKQLVSAALGVGQSAAGVNVLNATHKFEYVCAKYLRITDTAITGDDGNSGTGTSNGITYNNGSFALRYVIGV